VGLVATMGSLGSGRLPALEVVVTREPGHDCIDSADLKNLTPLDLPQKRHQWLRGPCFGD